MAEETNIPAGGEKQPPQQQSQPPQHQFRGGGPGRGPNRGRRGKPDEKSEGGDDLMEKVVNY